MNWYFLTKTDHDFSNTDMFRSPFQLKGFTQTNADVSSSKLVPYKNFIECIQKLFRQPKQNCAHDMTDVLSYVQKNVLWYDCQELNYSKTIFYQI